MTYDIIYADPPWSYGQEQLGGSSADKHYPTMSLAELAEMAPYIQSISNKDCLLFMWVSGPFLDAAIDLGRKWDFDYKQMAFVWDKVNGNPGFYTFTQVEPCLVFKRKGGKIPPMNKGARKTRQLVVEKKREHSRKPDGIRDSIDRMFSGPKIELFARVTSPGWDVMGNQTTKFNK